MDACMHYDFVSVESAIDSTGLLIEIKLVKKQIIQY